MTSRSTTHLGLFFLGGFGVMAMALAYWTFIARDELLARADNPRALIAFNRIRRGRIQDRNGLTLAETVGQPGDFVRQYDPAAAIVVGYASFTYGYSGIEAAANGALTGATDEDNLTRWWRYSVLDEPQIGRDVTLTLDRDLQRAAYAALVGRAGAVVVLDTASGEILVMASAPSFDPARLDAQFNSFTADSNGPLINRAALGLYPAGNLLGLFPGTLDLSQTPILPIAVAPAQADRITPVHLALLIGAVANDGVMPLPRLTIDPAPSAGHSVAIIPPADADRIRPLFVSGYNATTPAGIQSETLGWYAGLRPEARQVIVVVVERSDAAQAAAVARSVWGP